MTAYKKLSKEELKREYEAVSSEFSVLCEKGLKLNMARGKPSKAQLDMVSDIFDVVRKPEDFIIDGVDARNYGNLEGLSAARSYWADMLGVRPEQTFVGGNASLQLMYDLISKAYTHGLLHSQRPWCREEKIKWLCPVPGYDRHFKVTESFGFEMISVPMTDEGPDMDRVEELVKDPAVKGMWNVPKYSNPDGVIYSDATVRRIAALKPAAPDFLLMWDNAYCVHEFFGEFVPFLNILEECEKAGNADMVFEFASTSKITLPGAGMSVMAASEANISYLSKLIGIQIISYDKVNQLRHVKYLKDKEHTLELMKRHAAIMGPKFKAVLDTLDEKIAPLEIAQWKRPKGGYFVSFYAMPGTARRTLELCKQAGVTMTGAGATYPYGKDPEDSNIRIAPSLPPVSELEQALEVFCVCLRMATLEKLMA
ncbi:aminotransferase class I/II-fold pyridoxal phosphate-dependent enzyme [Oscillibacter hominis]|uniref:Aminotransferase class I/II-fold pyridoxal phosphate-dependent enzyme n=1 Tax=Oscillibacter hominis TaxID=2763056 RepID=A0A7G9B5W3_9FIRM|nr:aminotransferase class I/II-fold pyridoxal phosphate-dependent enzyme [Oscillibacter hominis]QNL44944.1 aminotransferase class I/II-fold pyridoxal phosphate-dependent enzyme [Oscillibacter hominis]